MAVGVPVSSPDQIKVPEVKLPTQTAQAFKEQFEALQHELDWLQDLTTFEQKARAVMESTWPSSVIQPLLDLTTTGSAPSAMLLTGLPIEKTLPPTLGDPPIAKDSQLTEALLVAVGCLWGHAYAYEGAQKRGCIKDLIAANSTVFSSTTELQMHRDFAIAPEQVVPHMRLIACMRPDKARQVETLVCDNRQLMLHLTDTEIHLLRTEPITFVGPEGRILSCSKPAITGPNDDPTVNLFDAAVLGKDTRVSTANPATSAAYQRASKVAKDIAQGFKLEPGQMLIINNNRATHARTESPVEPDGFGRWLKVMHVRSDINPDHRYVPMA